MEIGDDGGEREGVEERDASFGEGRGRGREVGVRERDAAMGLAEKRMEVRRGERGRLKEACGAKIDNRARVLVGRDDGRLDRWFENLSDLEHLSRVGVVGGIVDNLFCSILIDDCAEKS